MYIKGDLDSNQKIIGNGLVLNVDAAQYRSFPRGGNIVTSGLVLNLDAGNPSSYPGTGTTWFDISGNANNGTLTNGPTYNSANQGSIVFDGTNDYVDCGNGASLNFSTAITVAAWINTPQTTSYKTIVDKGRDNYGGWALSTNETTTPAACFKVRIGGVNRVIVANSNYGNNTWTYIVGTFNGTTLSIYQNGILSNSAAYSGTIGTNAITVRVGSANDGNYFIGNIANAVIYNRALSAAEILDNYNALKYRYGVIGSTWFDISGNANNGTLTNGPTLEFNNGGGIVFDGTNDTITANLNITPNNSTNSIWFKWNGTNQAKEITYIGGGAGLGFYISDGSGNVGNKVTVLYNGITFSATGTSATLVSGQYVNLVITRDTTTTRFYQNGVQIGSTTSTPNNSTVSSNLTTQSFGGTLGTVQIYNRALSAAEVTQNYDALKYRYGVIGSTWFDISGNANNGTLTNGPTFNSANGGSIVFDGTNDYVDFGNGVSLNFSTAITVGAWFKVPSQTVFKGIVDKGRDNFGGWTLGINETTTPNATFHVRIAGINRAIVANSNYGNNTWTYIVGTFNGTTLSIYQNGILSNSAAYSGTMGTNAISVRVGAANDGLYFPGNIANAFIYNRALSATEVLNNFNAVKSRFGF